MGHGGDLRRGQVRSHKVDAVGSCSCGSGPGRDDTRRNDRFSDQQFKHSPTASSGSRRASCGMPRECHSPGSRALRRGRYSHAGGIYLITTTTCAREPIFLDFRQACAAAAVITDRQSLGDSQLLAWVLMPDHLHLLLRIGMRDTLANVIGRIKSRSSTAVKRAEGRCIPVWFTGYHDRAIRRDEDVCRAARYVVANPIRAGLVQRCGDYPVWLP